MTIDPGEAIPPSPEDDPRADEHPGRDEMRNEIGDRDTAQPIKKRSYARRQEPGTRRDAHGVIGLAYDIVTSSANTYRFLLVTVVVVGMIIAVLWLLPLELSVGPVHIGRVQMHVQPSSAAR